MGVSHAEHEPTKTLGPRAARLVARLHERGRTLFTYADVRAVADLQTKAARNLVDGLVRRGLATRLKPGLFILVPFELGLEREYLGNPYVVARELADGKEYYLSHGSAMDLHQMVTQPQLVVFITSPHAVRPRWILGTEFRFVRCKAETLFGTVEHWVTKTERVVVSDPERTVVDGLKQPEHCGGLTEVAKGYLMRRDAMSVGRLVDYALRLNVGAVIGRLGFLLETFGGSAAADLERLRSGLSASYALLDPLLPAEGPYHARWRLRLNIDTDELLAVAST